MKVRSKQKSKSRSLAVRGGLVLFLLLLSPLLDGDVADERRERRRVLGGPFGVRRRPHEGRALPFVVVSRRAKSGR